MIATEIAIRAGCPDARTLLAASGTDAVMLATFLVADSDCAPLTTIVVGIEETGSGVAHAVIGCHFQSRTPKGVAVMPGAPVLPGRDLRRIELPLRDARGAPLDLSVIDAAVVAAARQEIAAGRRVVVHRLDSSKTGLTAPSLACLSTLETEFGDRFTVLVDACQLRASTASLAAYHRRGWPIVVTGSKFVTGPAFSGAIILPPATTLREPELPGYDRAEAPAPGVLLRWRAALEEWRRFDALSESDKAKAARLFAHIAVATLGGRSWVRPIDCAPRDRAARGGWDATPTIFTFALRDAAGDSLGYDALRHLFFHLLKPDQGVPAMRLGQPVRLGDSGLAALRLAFDSRLACILAEDSGAMRRITESLGEALDRLEYAFDRMQ